MSEVRKKRANLRRNKADLSFGKGKRYGRKLLQYRLKLSGVYDNEPFLLSALGARGKTDTPVEMSSQPFAESTIYTLTTANARNITIALTAIPTVICIASGLIILLRRKFA